MEGIRFEQLRVLFRWFKEGPPGAIPIERDGRSLGLLQAVTWEDAGNSPVVEQLATWHDSALMSFPEPFPVTPAGARQWLTECVLQTSDRVLFWVKDVRGVAIGHVGLSHHDSDNNTITIVDVLSSSPASEGLLAVAVQTLSGWAHQSLKLRVRQEGEHLAAA